jgi:uncharacterized protein YndB with AHSA1/START domain
MTVAKDFKRVVRARMQKTGESYTAARAILLSKPVPTPTVPPPVPTPTVSDYARLAGMSDTAIKASTGCTWERWVAALDSKKAYTWPHREIAEYVQEKYKVPDWWTQTVTVGYERIKGLRDIGQRRGGAYEATRSKTFAVPVTRLFRAFSDARIRRKWLPGVKLSVRKATPNRSVRITWDDDTSVEVWLLPKGTGKASASVAHRKLADKADAERRMAFWGERLEALAGVLTPSD